MLCPPSHLVAGIPIDSSGEASQVGSAAHAAMRVVVEDSLDHLPDLYEFANLHGVEDVSDLFFVAYRCMKDWKEYGEDLRVLAIEELFEGELVCASTGQIIKLSGHPDIVAEELLDDDPALVIFDWKTGYLDTDCFHQMMGYAVLAMRRWPQYNRVILIVSRPRFNRVDISVEFSRDALDRWQEELFLRLTRESFCPSDDACKYCPAAMSCEAKHATIRSASLDLVEQSEMEISDLERMARSYDKRKMVGRALEQWDKTFKEALQAAGSVSTGDGTELYLESSESESPMLCEAALPVLYESLGVEGAENLFLLLLDHLKIPKKDLSDIIGARSARGEKGANIKACFERLSELGAVRTSRRRLIKTRKETQDD